MDPCARAMAISALACELFSELGAEEALLLAADLVQLGDTLAAIAAHCGS